MANMRQVVKVCQSLLDARCKVTLCLPKLNARERNKRLTELNKFYQPSFKMFWFNNSFLTRALGKLGVPQLDIGKILDDYDLVFTRDPSIVRRIAAYSTPIVYEAHNYLFDQRGGSYDRNYQNLMLSIFKKKNNFIITISGALKAYLIGKGFDEKKIIVEHDCHDGKEYNIGNVAKSLKDVLDETHRGYKKLVAYTGSLAADRGLEILKNVLVKRPEVFFVIAGGSESQIDFWRNELGKHHNLFISERLNKDEVKYLQKQSDVLLGVWSSKIPTMDYCSPLKIFEYMAWGKPILLPDFPTFYEVLDEELAFFFKKQCADSLCHALDNALTALDNFKDKKSKILELAQYYTWEERARRIINFIELS
ncbi:glycosyltransferase family 4 protein [Akkermansiaceae bacterium]|nr:glycosyltransferase family 4 protein [Akkermansiaceae bacterium]